MTNDLSPTDSSDTLTLNSDAQPTRSDSQLSEIDRAAFKQFKICVGDLIRDFNEHIKELKKEALRRGSVFAEWERRLRRIVENFLQKVKVSRAVSNGPPNLELVLIEILKELSRFQRLVRPVFRSLVHPESGPALEEREKRFLALLMLTHPRPANGVADAVEAGIKKTWSEAEKSLDVFKVCLQSTDWNV